MPSMTEKRTRTSWQARREAVGLSMSELARRSGVNKGNLSRIERGWPATPSEAERLLTALLAAGAPAIPDDLKAEDDEA